MKKNLVPLVHPIPKCPPKTNFIGKFVQLEPLDIIKHEDDLWNAGGGKDNEDIWTYMPYGPFYTKDAFKDYLKMQEEQREAGSSIPMVVIHENKAIGINCYLRIFPLQRSVEIGGIWYSKSYWRTFANPETCWLMISYAFEKWGARRLEWKCNANNEKSKAAAKKLGFVYEGTFRNHMIVKGENRDTAWFSITDKEWEDETKKRLYSYVYERI